jgi:hypothetical protein
MAAGERPRASVYDPAGGSWYLQWFSVLLLVGTAMSGALAYAYLKRANRILPVVGEPAGAPNPLAPPAGELVRASIAQA